MNTEKSLVINLSKITEIPKEFSFDQDHPLMSVALRDLLKSNHFKIKFTLARIGDGYELKGNFEVKLDLLCSKCAIDFKEDIAESMNELFVIQEKTTNYIDERAPGGHQIFEAELSDSAPFCNIIESQDLDLGDFCHEVIALSEPLQPKAPDCSEICPNLKASEIYKAEHMQPAENELSPFSVLKNLKM